MPMTNEEFALIAGKLTTLKHLKALATKSQEKIAAVKTLADASIKKVITDGNTINFYLDKDATAASTADFTINLPAELFLDQTKTQFVGSFAFSAQTYPGATDPNLDGKPVMVLAVKGSTNADGTANTTLTYSFLDMSKLVDTYTVKAGDSAKVLNISGYEVEFKISSTAGNALKADSNGLFVGASAAANNAVEVKTDGFFVDITGKADKVSGATADDIAMLDANGNLADSGISTKKGGTAKTGIVVVEADIASDTDVTTVISDVFDGE